MKPGPAVVRRAHGVPGVEAGLALLRAYHADQRRPRRGRDERIAYEAIGSVVGELLVDDDTTIALRHCHWRTAGGYGLVRVARAKRWTLQYWPDLDAAIAWAIDEADAGHVPPRVPEVPAGPEHAYTPSRR